MDPPKKCIVPACRNYTGIPDLAISFFIVPSTVHKVYQKWTQFLQLSGERTEKICEEHFSPDDFITNCRNKLKPDALPRISVLDTNAPVNSGLCCVAGCPTKKRNRLESFPLKPTLLRKWKHVLKLDETVRTDTFKICRRHFYKTDFFQVTSKYLKPNAVPSKKVTHLVRVPKRCLPIADRPAQLRDHTYSKFVTFPRSNRICFVRGCRSRAGAGVILHSFPPKNDHRFKNWIHILKCEKLPTANSMVCSLHFVKHNYLIGGKHLKKDAVPSLRIPGVIKSCDKRNKRNTHDSVSSHGSSSETSYCSSPGSPVQSINQSTLDENYIHLYDDNSFQIGHNEESSQDINVPLSISDNHHDHELDLPSSNNDERNLEQLKIKEVNNQMIVKCVKPEARCNRSCDVILSDLLVSDKELNVWTGIPTFALLEEICLTCSKLEAVICPRKFKMHTTDRVILVLARLKQNISFEALGTLFRISGVTVSKYFSHTIQLMVRVLNRFVYLPSKEDIKKNIPLCFRERFPNVTIVVDCTEVPIATLKCLNCRISCYSNYKSRRTVKFLIGVTPAGLISFASTAYSGKASDKFIFNNEHLIDRLQAHVDEIMVDKGVTIENECSNKCIKLHIPPFMRGERLTTSEASRNESIARARIHVERVIQRIKIFEIFNGTIHSCILGHIDDIVTTICGIVNLSQPVLNDDKF